MELLTAAEMRAIERAAIDGGAVSGLELMERAGAGVVTAILARWPELAGAAGASKADGAHADGGAGALPQTPAASSPVYLGQEKGGLRAAVLCGPGNNGGDGFVVARLLAGLGWDVDVLLYGDPDALPPDARTNYARWRELGAVHDAGVFHAFEKDRAPDLVVDALFGTGLTRPISDPVLWERLWSFDDCAKNRVLRDAGRPGPRVPPRSVAIDIPSGLDADSGRVLGQAEHGLSCGGAMLTVTFHSEKLGHMLAQGPELCGALVVADIGLRATADAGVVRRVEPACARRVALKGGQGHKYDHGHALVVSGPMGRSGAARLAARGALRVGAGLVTVAAPGSAMMECATQLSAIMLRRCDGAEGLAALLEDARLTALCLGPGLGVGAETRAMVEVALRAGRAVVLDADALSTFAQAPGDLFAMLHPRVVLTPHGGEFARLFPDLAARLAAPADAGPAYSRVNAAREAAARAGCVVLLKGPDTVIAEPGGRCSVHAAAYGRAAPWLATAGSGDVLAGMIAGILARGFGAREAAEAGAWLHVEAARAFGPGLIAEDLPEMVPQVFAALEAG